jgi:hypothetical protein
LPGPLRDQTGPVDPHGWRRRIAQRVWSPIVPGNESPSATRSRRRRFHRLERKDTHMNYGIGGILILILVILAIVFFAKRV